MCYAVQVRYQVADQQAKLVAFKTGRPQPNSQHLPEEISKQKTTCTFANGEGGENPRECEKTDEINKITWAWEVKEQAKIFQWITWNKAPLISRAQGFG